MTSSLVELRVLEGPNLYFPRAAIKLTLDLTGVIEAPEERALRFAARIGLTRARPGKPGSGFRQRFAARAVGRLVRQIAGEAGTTRLAVRVRPTNDVHRLVVAYPWRSRTRAQALGRAVADVLDAVTVPEPVAAPNPDIDGLVSAAAATVRAAEAGPGPTTLRPRIPIVAVTGTNGKTTTSRMVAHIARTHGLHVGWSSTDGIYIDGELVEAGDYSGPSGAGRVLAHPEVQLAVTETARGGILLKGIGLAYNNVSVFTNVSADHLGMHGIDTVDQLAEVKGIVSRITRPDGWAVLNADDPRVLATRAHIKARPWAFSRDPDSPALREVLGDGGRVTTVIDGWLCVIESDSDPDPLIELVDVPMTLAGLSRFNVENALGAASAALAVGLPRAAVVEGLRSFKPDPEHNPGRMNFFTRDDVSVVVDLAHNEAGLEALLEIMNGVRRPGARLLLGLGAVGDRMDDIVESLGEKGARDADVAVIAHKERYLRGRSTDELDELFRRGAARVGVEDLPSYPSELAGLQALVDQAEPGDVVGLMCHEDRAGVYDWLATAGFTPDTPETLRQKVKAAQA
ncbi:MAG TPA: Mur ligase family protein [Nocardioides sp.]|uniref:Mur ligase family protein n=1 Tax=Nocardioides sp. TaxID=35761 RepID=UPI002D7F7399|nr:Mur ligase family protein [Nocardioides sp.]HET6653559.1 Mur ligase family protein [Nocardioides sp.]